MWSLNTSRKWAYTPLDLATEAAFLVRRERGA